MSELNSQELLQQYQDGHSDAATALFDRYVERLIALARRRIGPKLRRRIDAEDVIQSAYRSFFVHAKDGRYQLAKAGDLWRLLAAITLNKLRGQIEKQSAAKRSIDCEVPTDSALIAAKAPEPSADEVVAIVEELHLVVDRLRPGERTVLTARLQGQSIPEISEETGRSERTIRRLLTKVRQRIEERLYQRDTVAVGLPRAVAKTEAPLLYTNYVLEQLTGSGGMGKVFRAREKSTGKKVAIKALHKARQSDLGAVSQFVQEAQILSNLSHPNIVGVQGLGRFPGGGYFLVMDFVDGIDLQSRLTKGPLPIEEALPIVRKIAEAVGYAHAHGIVHCDLKPANVLLDKQGRVFVTDFGFAFLATSEGSDTRIGGTVGFIPPEILCFQNQPTPTADIFSLGALLWTLTTGEIPSDNSDLNSEPRPPFAILPFCLKCLSGNPEDRYRSMDQVLNALTQVWDEFH